MHKHTLTWWGGLFRSHYRQFVFFVQLPCCVWRFPSLTEYQQLLLHLEECPTLCVCVCVSILPADLALCPSIPPRWIIFCVRSNVRHVISLKWISFLYVRVCVWHIISLKCAPSHWGDVIMVNFGGDGGAQREVEETDRDGKEKRKRGIKKYMHKGEANVSFLCISSF